MVDIVKFVHHDVVVSGFRHMVGKHRQHCLCFQKCKHFKIGQDDNCEIAQANYELCVKHNTTQPVLECPKFEVAKTSG